MKKVKWTIRRSVRLVSMLSVFMLTTGIQPGVYGQQRSGSRIEVPVETITDKIRGGLLGQLIGNLNGLPHENKYVDEPGNVLNYIPELAEGAWTDDDTDFEWVYIVEMQKKRSVFLPYSDITALWKERINRRIWCSNRYARHLMDIGIHPTLTSNVLLNPWADFNVSGQFLCETFGLLAPAMPQTASRIGLHYTNVAIDLEPAQTTQLFTTMIATAFVENDVYKVVDAGIAALDPQSTILQIALDCKEWYARHPGDWKETRRLLRDKYTREGGGMRDKNGSELNTGAIIAALLYGAGDFAETLRLAFNMGWDADCNAATVGTIVGVMDGYRKLMVGSDESLGDKGFRIIDRYRNTTRDNMPTDETITSFADRLIELFELVLEENGGKKTFSQAKGKLVYEIESETPRPVIKIKSEEDFRAELLKIEPTEQIVHQIVKGSGVDRARAAYIAISLDMHTEISQKYPKQWEEAKYELSGYWKVMNNVFSRGFKALDAMRAKFAAAGLKSPGRYSDDAIYNDKNAWKDPKELYSE